MGTLSVVVGGQFGSEAKGHVAGYLCRPEEFDAGLAIRVAGPNAGHSVVNPTSGVKHALRQIPAAAVTNPGALLAIAAGSEVDADVLEQEIQNLEADGIKVRERLYIDRAATVLEHHHIDAEQQSGIIGRIGSTGKGIGAARAARIQRVAQTVGGSHPRFSHLGTLTDTAILAAHSLAVGHDVLVEGTQGYGLGLHTPYYPKVTSSDCRAIDFLAMAGISPWQAGVGQVQIWVVVRPYPIRVAGDSGPMYHETFWAKLGLPEEITTVTKKVRRVGLWDGPLVAAAVQANGGLGRHLRIALTMADQIDPNLVGGRTWDDVATQDLVRWIDENMLPLLPNEPQLPDLITTSPSTLIDLRRFTG